MISIFGVTPDVKGLYEATRPEYSDYWDKQKAHQGRASQRKDKSALLASEMGLSISIEWDKEALEQFVSSPKFVRKFAVGNVEDFALEKGYQRITVEIIKEQMKNAGVAKFMKFLKK